MSMEILIDNLIGIRSDLDTLTNDIAFERTDLAETHNIVGELHDETDNAVGLALSLENQFDELTEYDDQVGVLTGTIESIIRDLEWTDPDGSTTRDLRDAVRKFMVDSGQRERARI